MPAAEITVAEGVITHPNGAKASFGDLVKEAAQLPVPTDIELKPASAWRLIGKESVRRVDSLDKTTGRQRYTLDMRLPGMLTAVVAHPPRFGATVASFDAGAAKAVKGVVEVVAIPRGVAVVAESTWAARKGRDALKVTWDEDKAEKRGSEEIIAEYHRLAGGTEAVKVNELGDVEAALGTAAKVIEASYEFPYLAHAALEPLNAVAARSGDLNEVWGGHQLPDLYQRIAAEIAGVPTEQVRLHVMAAGGSFGRRAVADGDIVAEAVSTAKAIGWKAPVKLVWTREDDMTGGRYRPAYVHTLKAGLSADGKLIAWRHRIVGQSILKGTFFEPFLVHGGIDGTSVEGSQLPYAVPNHRTGLITTENGVPVLWWRSVGSTHNAYVLETVMGELATAAGRDPIEFRLSMLADQPRHRAVLERVRDESGWAKAPPEGIGRGVALAESFGSFVAQVAEVRLVKGALKVERVVCAVDCGLAVNPDVVKAQMEGAIGFGLGAVLKGAITLDGGRVEQSNFDGYDVLRINEMPKVEVHIVPSKERSSGVGEPGTPPIGPAVANAIAALTGQRIRALPISRHKLVST